MTTTRQAYLQCLDNLNAFYKDTGIETRIKFVYYAAKDLAKPKTREVFRTMRLAHDTAYIVHGKDVNFFYVYSKQNLRLMLVGAASTTKVRPYNAVQNAVAHVDETGQVNVISTVDDNGATTRTFDEAYIGNHVDFAVVAQRNGGVLFKTHQTAYEIVDNRTLHAIRHTDSCNFRWSPSPSHVTHVDDISCETKTGIAIGKPIDIYGSNATEFEAFKLLYNVATGQYHDYQTTGGGAPEVHTGKRGGKFFMRGPRRVYLSKKKEKDGFTRVYRGGNDGQVLSDDMLMLIQNGLLAPIQERCGDAFFAAQLLHDAGGELGNADIVFVLYEFAEVNRRVTFELSVRFLVDVLESVSVVRRSGGLERLQLQQEDHARRIQAWNTLRERVVQVCVAAA